MATLYEILGQYADAVTAIDMAESEEEEQDAWAALEQIGDDLGHKADAYARIVRNMEADAKALRDEEKRLAEIRRHKENAVERMKDAIMQAMIATGQKRLDTGIGRWMLRATPHVEITDAGAVPREFQVIQAPKINKADILAAWRRDGELIPGTEIVECESVSFR